MRVDILTKSFDCQSSGVQLEPWFGVPYRIENIPSALIEDWENPPIIHPSIRLPDKNDFIPCDFSIKSSSDLNIDGTMENPTCIIDDPLIRIWYKLDQRFNCPHANTYFLITLKEAYKSTRTCVLTKLYVDLLGDALNETLYQADVAKLVTTFSILGDKLEFKISGFNEKLPVLAAKIIKFLTTFTPDADRFEIYIEGLCHGNLLKDEAISLANMFKDLFSATVLPSELRHTEKILKLPSGIGLLQKANVKNKSEENSAVEIYFQVDQDAGQSSTRTNSITDLFEEIVYEQYFDQLRTKEQLGYAVSCGRRMTYRVLGFCFSVLSSKHSPPYLQERIDAFIDKLQRILDEMDDKEFESYKVALIARKLEKDSSVTDEADRYWTQVVEKRYLFEVLKLEADELTSIQKSDVIDWYNSFLNANSSRCRRLNIHVWGCNANKAEAAESTKLGNVIDDVSALKLTSEFYPSLC